MATAFPSVDCNRNVDLSYLNLEGPASTLPKSGTSARNKLSEIAIRATAVALANKYIEIRQSLIDRGIDHKSTEGIEFLRSGAAQIEAEITVPRAGMKMDLVRWYKMQLRRILYQRFHRESVERGELGANMPYISDDLHLSIDPRRSALAKTLTSERMRGCKHAAHAFGIKNVAEAVGLQGIFVTITSLEGDNFFRDGWRSLQRRIGQMLGFWVREPHLNGRPHWHLLLYVEPERLARLQKLVVKIFGFGPSANVKPVVPGSSKLIPYLLKSFDMREFGTTDMSDLTRRASSFRALGGKRGIQFLDCASSKTWDRLRAVKEGSAAFQKLNPAEITLRASALRNDYQTFIILSAREIVKRKPTTSALIKRIAASGQEQEGTHTAELTMPTRATAGRKALQKRTVAHSNKNNNLKPREERDSGSAQISPTTGRSGTNEHERVHMLSKAENELSNVQETPDCVSAVVLKRPTVGLRKSVESNITPTSVTPEQLIPGGKPFLAFLGGVWVFMRKFFAKVSFFFAKKQPKSVFATDQSMSPSSQQGTCKNAGASKLDCEKFESNAIQLRR